MAANDTLFFYGDSKVAIDNPVAYHQIVASGVGRGDRYWGKFGRTIQSLSTNSVPSIQSFVEANTLVYLNDFQDGIFRYDISMDKYFICFGTNDVIQYQDSNSTAANFKIKYRAYLNKLLTDAAVPKEKLRMINCDIIDFTKFPVPSNVLRLEAFNQVIADLGVEFGVLVIDVYSNQIALNNPSGILSEDGLHLSTLGNQVNANYIIAHLNDDTDPPVDPPDDIVGIVRGRNIIVV